MTPASARPAGGARGDDHQPFFVSLGSGGARRLCGSASGTLGAGARGADPGERGPRALDGGGGRPTGVSGAIGVRGADGAAGATGKRFALGGSAAGR